MELIPVALEDKYTLQSGRIYLSGIQALVRLPMMQRQRDRAAGLRTAGFISGYRGSPLGGYDTALWYRSRGIALAEAGPIPVDLDAGASQFCVALLEPPACAVRPGAPQETICR